LAAGQAATEAEALDGIAVVAAVWVGTVGPVCTGVAVQASVGVVAPDGIVVAPDAVARLVEVEGDIEAVAEEQGARSVAAEAGVVVEARVLIAAALDGVGARDEFAAARDAVVVPDGSLAERDDSLRLAGRVELAGDCWFRLDGVRVGWDD
jgi:hypothetical protein